MDNRIFDEWEEVNCNDCELWWINQCDGTQKGEKRLCTSFKATRSVVIPLQIKSLQRRLKWLIWAFGFTAVVQLLGTISILIYLL